MTVTEALAPHLPYLRRYARALTGSQSSGDAYVRAALDRRARRESRSCLRICRRASRSTGCFT